MLAELSDPPFLSTRTLAVSWFMGWRLTGVILLPGSAITAFALARSSVSTLVPPILVGWYCALAIFIAACVAINYFAGRWAEREYDRALPDNIWWGVVWRTGLVALPFAALAVSALAASPVLHRWAWALAGGFGAAALVGSALMLGWSTAHMVHRSLTPEGGAAAEEPTEMFHDVAVPAGPPSCGPASPEARVAPQATPTTGQSPRPSPVKAVVDLSGPGYLTRPAGPLPEPKPHWRAPEPVPRGWSPATQTPAPSPVPEENPVPTGALGPSPSATARPRDAPYDHPSDLVSSAEAKPLPLEPKPAPKDLSPAGLPSRPTPIPAGAFQTRYWQNSAGGWEVEISLVVDWTKLGEDATEDQVRDLAASLRTPLGITVDRLVLLWREEREGRRRSGASRP